MTLIREWLVKGAVRSSGWFRLRTGHVRENPHCAVCNSNKNLEVHHIIPVFMNASLELEPSNLITLCKRHHFSIGHLEDWSSYNPSLFETIELWKKILSGRP